MQGVGGSV
jgi:hypothetical protein